MKKNKLWLGILVVVLAFGMTVVGCDDGDLENGNGGSGSSNSSNCPRNEGCGPSAGGACFDSNCGYSKPGGSGKCDC